jgi:ferritin
MINKKILDLLNSQINKELYSAYLYLGISQYYNNAMLEGFGNWYKIQAKEEQDHADLIMQYIQNCGAEVVLEAISKPNVEYSNIKQGIEASLEHERFISREINTIYGAALEEKDYKTVEFLTWFIKEQVEEEKNAEEQLKKFELFNGDKRALYMLDRELAARVYSAPSLILS